MSSGPGGSVFIVRRKVDNVRFVLKRIPLVDVDEAAREQAKLEVELMQQLHHPHIVAFEDAFLFDDEDLCIVMEYYSTGDLSDALSRKKQPMGEREVMEKFVQIALAIHYLHSHRIVHRDIKAQNVFIGTTGEIALGDFGVAKILRSGQDTSATTSGTPLYMAPEVLQGNLCSFKSDVWSLGCILAEMLCRKHPFDARDMNGLVLNVIRGSRQPIPPQYPRHIQRLVDKLLEGDPRRRPLIDEVLMMSSVKGYVHEYMATRTPTGPPDSPREQILALQMQALGIRAEIVVHHTNFEPGTGQRVGGRGGPHRRSQSPPQQAAEDVQRARPKRMLRSPSPASHEPQHGRRAVAGNRGSLHREHQREDEMKVTQQPYNTHLPVESDYDQVGPSHLPAHEFVTHSTDVPIPPPPKHPATDRPQDVEPKVSQLSQPGPEATAKERIMYQKLVKQLREQEEYLAALSAMREEQNANRMHVKAAHHNMVYGGISASGSVPDTPQVTHGTNDVPSALRHPLAHGRGGVVSHHANELPLDPHKYSANTEDLHLLQLEREVALYQQANEQLRMRQAAHVHTGQSCPPNSVGVQRVRKTFPNDSPETIAKAKNRAKALRDACIHSLGEGAFMVIYDYMRRVPFRRRDDVTMRSLVGGSDRALGVLPQVDELVTMDRTLQAM